MRKSFVSSPLRNNLPMPNSIVLGVDPGLANCGWSVVQHTAGKYCHIDSGVILTRAHAPIGKRLETRYKMIRQMLTKHSPDIVSIESVFFNRNISYSVIKSRRQRVFFDLFMNVRRGQDRGERSKTGRVGDFLNANALHDP